MTAAILATILSAGSAGSAASAGSAGGFGLRANAPASAGAKTAAPKVASASVPLVASAPASVPLVASAPASVPLVASAYRSPQAGAPRVLTPFNPPADRYGPGHLGVDLAAVAGVGVLAAGAGVVRFAGQVAGRGVVVLAHPDGISTEYEPVAVAVVAGQRVLAGQRIGSVRGSHRSCAPASCLHWGARRGTAYLDPMALLKPLGDVRLLPWS